MVADATPVQWQHYWHCQLCSYPDRTGDLRSIVKIADFYLGRQWHSIGTRCGINQPLRFEHALMLTLPATPGLVPGSGRSAGRPAGPGLCLVGSWGPGLALRMLYQDGLCPLRLVKRPGNSRGNTRLLAVSDSKVVVFGQGNHGE